MDNPEPERALWSAVITQAFIDATSNVWEDKKANSVRDYERRQARAWLVDGGTDFRDVCNLAGYDPDWIQRMARQMEADGWPTCARQGRRHHDRS